METELLNKPLVVEWLAEIRRETTRSTYRYRFSNFLTYFGITPKELLNKTPKEARTLCLRYQNENTKESENTRLGVLSTVSSFLAYHDKPIHWKRNQKLRPRADTSSHVFTNGDLLKMFDVADIRDKAILALATSLGWEIDGFIDLDKQKIKALIKRAKDKNLDYIYFHETRTKTGVPRLGIINPLAIEWLDKWFKASANIPKMERKQESSRVTASERVSELFDITGCGIRYALQTLAKKANLTLTGRIRFHNIRKWVMSGLSRSGFNEFQIKYVLGKAIGMADSTYLQTLEVEIRERYPSAFEHYLNLTQTISATEKNRIKERDARLKEENKELKRKMENLEAKLERMAEQLGTLLNSR